MDEPRKMPDRASERAIAEEASRWLERLAAGTGDDPVERREFADWLRRSPRNVHYFLLSTALDRSLESIDAERRIDVEQLIAESARGIANIAPHRSRHESRPGSERSPRSFAHHSVRVAAVAALVLGVVGGWSLWYGHRTDPYVTSVGEQRTVQLPDGSVVQLNTDSRIAVRFTEQLRRIELLQGEALFKVTKDGGQRPFQVLALDSLIQALGTQFNVYSRTDGVAVAVLEGKVAVQARSGEPSVPGGGSNVRAAVLQAGEEATVGRGIVRRIANPDVSNAVAWRQRRLVFKVTPLHRMVEEFNRYNRTKIRLEGIDGESRHYTGTFDADDPESLALLLSQDPELSVQRREGEILILQRR